MTIRLLSALLIGPALAAAPCKAVAQTSFAELDTGTRTVALKAITVIKEQYYKEVSSAALAKACVDAVAARNAAGIEKPDGLCLAAMVSQLDGQAHYAVLDDAARAPTEKSVSRPVSGTLLAGDVLLIAVPVMGPDAPRQLIDALAAVQETKLRGVILDLRGNQGGLLLTPAALAAPFLPLKTRVATLQMGRAGQKEELRVTGEYHPDFSLRGENQLRVLPGYAQTVPLLVLIDEGTASGAELLAAALQDHRRATLVGRKTMGRATIASVVSLTADSYMKLPTGQFLRPSGLPIDGRGVSPDLSVPADKDLETALAQLQQQ